MHTGPSFPWARCASTMEEACPCPVPDTWHETSWCARGLTEKKSRKLWRLPCFSAQLQGSWLQWCGDSSTLKQFRNTENRTQGYRWCWVSTGAAQRRCCWVCGRRTITSRAVWDRACCCSVAKSRPAQGLQHAGLPCPSLFSGVYSDYFILKIIEQRRFLYFDWSCIGSLGFVVVVFLLSFSLAMTITIEQKPS